MVSVKRWVKGKPKQAELPADEELPEVTFLVCAYNEQDVVEMKMQNIHQLDYPREKLQLRRKPRLGIHRRFGLYYISRIS